MEPRNEHQQNHTPGQLKESPMERFRLIRLEERIALSRGGNGTHNCGGFTANATHCICSLGCTL